MPRFYFTQLNPLEKQLYRMIERAISRYQAEILLPSSLFQPDRMEEISRLVTIDYPEYYWTKGSFDVSFDEKGLLLRFTYLLPKEEREEIDGIIFRRISEMKINEPGDVYGNIMKIAAWFRENVEYDSSADSLENRLNQTVYSVFVEGKSLCMGIAKAFDMMMRLMGLDSLVALGNVFEEERVGHSWNMVKYDNRYLQTDLTMAYPVFGSLWERYHGDQSNECVLVPFEYIAKSHSLNRWYRYPVDSGN